VSDLKREAHAMRAAAEKLRRSDAAREADRLDMEPLFDMDGGAA
jgi:hypothetical protein